MKFETWKYAMEECLRREKITGKVHTPCTCLGGFFIATSINPLYNLVNE